MVIADSSVWIVFQRDPASAVGREMDLLLARGDIVMVGPVLAEILQGSRSERELAFFADHLSSLTFRDADQATWVRVGELGFELRRQGLTLAFADLIISALATQYEVPLYTLDQDFQRIPGLQLYKPEAG